MMTKRILFLSVVGLLLLRCSGQPTTPSEESTIEGTVKYFPGGGTVEMQYLPGFILTDYQWITAPSWLVSPSLSDSLHHVYPGIYLKGIVDSSYIDKRVKVVGNASQSTISGILPNYKATEYVIKVDTLKVIH